MGYDSVHEIFLGNFLEVKRGCLLNPFGKFFRGKKRRFKIFFGKFFRCKKRPMIYIGC